jgi:hypothetical protein
MRKGGRELCHNSWDLVGEGGYARRLKEAFNQATVGLAASIIRFVEQQIAGI